MTCKGQRSRSKAKMFEVISRERNEKEILDRRQIGSHVWTFKWYDKGRLQMTFKV